MLEVILSHRDEQDLLRLDSVAELLRILHTVVAIEGENLHRDRTRTICPPTPTRTSEDKTSPVAE